MTADEKIELLEGIVSHLLTDMDMFIRHGVIVKASLTEANDFPFRGQARSRWLESMEMMGKLEDAR